MTQTDEPPAKGSPGAHARLIVGGILGLTAFALFVGLGTWQLQRRVWKLDLIATVNARVHAPPSLAPGPADWPNVTAAHDAYRRVSIAGAFENDRETLVQAVTELGPGFWVMTPLVSDRGFAVLVNRGFVPPERADPGARPLGQVTGPVLVTGLLRISEPKGGFLRRNDPAHHRWYSRDVTAIAAARGLSPSLTAPYFIDADGTSNPGGLPVGGLTVIAFPNSHLVYALTWYGLALLLAAGLAYAAREEWRIRSGAAREPDDGRRAQPADGKG
jgi:surfeit locus 1 family protein